MKNKPILVTGGAGYIGSHAVVALVEQGYLPVIVDDLRNSQADVPQKLDKLCGVSLPFFPVDCCDSRALEAIFEKFDFDGVIHFAAYKAVGESVEEPLKYYQNNLGSLVALLECCKKFGVNNIVFSSSCTVYGQPEGHIEMDESAPIQKANSPYGETKIICEQILKDYQSANPKSKVVCLRYFNPIGAHPSAEIGELPLGKPNNLVPFITQTAVGKWPKLTVFGNDYPTKDGTCIRDFIHVCDLADAHVNAIAYAEKSTGIWDAINVGTGEGTSVLELIQIFEKVSGEKLSYEFGPRRSGDVIAIYANANKANKVLGWTAKRTLEDSMSSAWKWQQNCVEHAS